LSCLLREQNIRISIPNYPILESDERNWIANHLPAEDYKKLMPYLKKNKLIYCEQTTEHLPPRKFMEEFQILRTSFQGSSTTKKSTTNWKKYPKTEGTLQIYTDGAIDTNPTGTRNSGIGICCKEIGLEIAASTPTARDSIQAELQAICLAIQVSPKEQQLAIHTDSERAIRAIQTKQETTKHRIRRSYSTELDYIHRATLKNQLSINWEKVRAYNNIPGNDQADSLARIGKGQDIQTFEITIETPTITDLYNNPISQDPRKWIKKRAQTEGLLRWQEDTLKTHISTETINQTDWTATAQVWNEEGHITGGTNSFAGAHTRTFKTKVLHERLPTATRQRLYDNQYPSTTCLHCQQQETTKHVLVCLHTKINLTTILINLMPQQAPELDPNIISATFFHPDPQQQANLIRGLIPKTWTEHNTATRQTTNAAINLINVIINSFRKLIWNPWCRSRKSWEKTNTIKYTGPKNDNGPKKATKFIHDKLNAIMHYNLNMPI
jgi:ribonuclease HI